ncbi:MAG: shikimate dehydrogenase [Anaerolineaceae bacterium]|nr:shikimate dehydrogenase [Anaerolineaceae bacterium]
MTNKVGIIGWPVAHSISPAIHNAAFAALGMTDWHYDAVPIPPDIVRQGLKTLKGEGGYVGVNVTIPHKQTVIPYVRPDERARAVGAVNTIDFRDDTATNTDVLGFIGDLEAYDVPLAGTRVIVLGAGGAARAAVYGLAQAGAEVVVVNRTRKRAQEMLANLALSANLSGVEVMTLDDAAEWGAGLIVNCTSVGMWPHTEESPWINGVPFPKGVTVYDMVYRPEKTLLMKQAEANGGRAIGGLGMLVRQGAKSFEIWTGQPAPVDVMLAAARDALGAR